MHEERLSELIHLDLDGEATPQQRLELEQHLERDPDGRQTRDAIRAVHRTLDERPRVDPPDTFREQIADAVRRASVTEMPAGRFSARSNERTRFTRVILAAAAVIILTVIFAPALIQELDENQLRGTMAPATDVSTASDRTPIQIGGIEGTALTRSDGRELIVQLELESLSIGQLEVTYDPERLRVETVAGLGAVSSEVPGTLEAELIGDTPRIRFVRLRDDRVSLSVNIAIGGAESGFIELHVPASTNFFEPEL